MVIYLSRTREYTSAEECLSKFVSYSIREGSKLFLKTSMISSAGLLDCGLISVRLTRPDLELSPTRSEAGGRWRLSLLDKRVLMFQSHTNGDCEGLLVDARLTPPVRAEKCWSSVRRTG
jgi:hypothetical protein